MATNLMSLAEMSVGQRGRVIYLGAKDRLRQKMLGLGLICATPVEVLHESPMQDPKAYCIRGAVIALRSEDASQVTVELDS
ncbi:MAG: hypothetical protein DDT20_00586 [Firmicutes bacterium]|nr:hypothetical protein [Bacillota bacterium]